MKVMSLFDGMSCGQIALKKLGAKVDTYYASEIDKYAMKVAKENFPNIVHLGDVTTVKREDFSPIFELDLLIGGSPCQGFSKSGNRLNFEDPRSKLFFEFVRILKEFKPKYFLLENVVMNKESRDIISEYLGVEPIEINSNLVSAQSRRRLYWTNIPNVTVPEDKGIVIKDILEDKGIADIVINQGKQLQKADIKKSHCLMARDYKGFGNQGMTGIRLKDNPIVSKDGLNHVGNEIEIVKIRKHQVDIKGLQDVLRYHKGRVANLTISQIAFFCQVPKTQAEHWFRTDSSFSIPDEESWMFLKECLGIETKQFDKSITEFEYREGVFEQSARVYHVDGKAPTLTSTLASKQKVYIPLDKVESKNGLILKGHAELNGHDVLKRVYDKDGKSPTLNTCGGGNREPKISLGDKQWRKLTPLECERLQTVPDNYTSSVSNTQRYKMLGNGWTVDVIAHLFKNITTKGETYERNYKQVSSETVSQSSK
jgi:site-specific DNA-cytosine methylase